MLIFHRATGMEIFNNYIRKILQPHHSSLFGASGSGSVLPSPQQPRPRRDEITSLETFRAILECGSSQSQDNASLKHQTTQISEESEEENL